MLLSLYHQYFSVGLTISASSKQQLICFYAFALPQQLAKLRVFELMGNPCSEVEEYRAFTIYYLNALAVGNLPNGVMAACPLKLPRLLCYFFLSAWMGKKFRQKSFGLRISGTMVD